MDNSLFPSCSDLVYVEIWIIYGFYVCVCVSGSDDISLLARVDSTARCDCRNLCEADRP